MKIIADDKIPFLKGALEEYADVVYVPGREITRELLTDADALLVRTRTKCNEQLLDGTQVKFIGTATIGFDHIDTSFCESRGIHWTNAPGCNSSSVRQYIAAAITTFAETRDISLEGKTMGVIGVGNVGSKVGQLAGALGMRVLLNDPPRERKEGKSGFVPISTILSESDIISVHVPLSRAGEDRTYHLFGDEVFAKLKKGCLFVNSSRGEVVETAALFRVIDSGKLSGAILDVWEHEPYINLDLLEKVILGTPHIAGYSADGKANGTSMTVNALGSFFGLERQYWYPPDIPLPVSTSIHIDGKNKTDQNIIFEAIRNTYDIMSDDKKLRNYPRGFEEQRSYYPLRREFTSYSIRLENAMASVAEKLAKIGFTIL